MSLRESTAWKASTFLREAGSTPGRYQAAATGETARRLASGGARQGSVAAGEMSRQ